MKGIYRKELLFESKHAAAESGASARHMHDEYELYYFLEGDAEYVVGEHVYPLAPHDLLFIRPAVYHFPVLHTQSPYRRMVLNFSEEIVPEGLRQGLQSAAVFRHAPPTETAGQLFMQAERATALYEEDAFLALRSLLTLMLLAFRHETPVRIREKCLHPRLGEILRYIDAHTAEPMNAASLAAMFFVSPSWLTHAFSEHLHIGVAQYIHSKKILRAQRLIRSGTPPTQAAQACGFASYPTFFRLYRSILGISPAQDKR